MYNVQSAFVNKTRYFKCNVKYGDTNVVFVGWHRNIFLYIFLKRGAVWDKFGAKIEVLFQTLMVHYVVWVAMSHSALTAFEMFLMMIGLVHKPGHVKDRIN